MFALFRDPARLEARHPDRLLVAVVTIQRVLRGWRGRRLAFKIREDLVKFWIPEEGGSLRSRRTTKKGRWLITSSAILGQAGGSTP
eukprot:scaffold256_cov261-Pinguiococcus_pyrenoidosus.AAC.28